MSDRDQAQAPNPYIKICGVTRPDDAALAAKLGATHLSCVMTAESPWFVPPAQAKDIAQAAGKKVRAILSSRNATVETVLEAVRQSGIKSVQLANYREPDAQAVEKAGCTVFRVHEVPTGANMLPPLTPEPSERSPAVLQVAAVGSGLTFPWEILGTDAPAATFIAGGVRPENVCALLTHHPYGIAINSGLESEPGIKDPDRMQLFFETIAEALE
jgi:indole-3-glycerol phosphate synthase/phosphoribosylanthranilate isomerase